MRRTEVLIPAATGRTYGGQSSRKQKAVDFVGFHLCEIPGLGKSTETKQIRGRQGLLAVYGVPFWGEEKVSKLEGRSPNTANVPSTFCWLILCSVNLTIKKYLHLSRGPVFDDG